jgi:hypothetical protein
MFSIDDAKPAVARRASMADQAAKQQKSCVLNSDCCYLSVSHTTFRTTLLIEEG